MCVFPKYAAPFLNVMNYQLQLIFATASMRHGASSYSVLLSAILYEWSLRVSVTGNPSIVSYFSGPRFTTHQRPGLGDPPVSRFVFWATSIIKTNASEAG